MSRKKDKDLQTFYASEKRFRALIEKASEGVVMYDKSGTISYVSPSIKNVGDYDENELMGLNGMQLIHPDDRAMSLEKFEEVAKTHGKTTTFRQRLKHKKGEFKWCETTLTNLLHEPDVESIISNFRDISRQKAAEDQLLESKALLESINQNINEAIYRNVHGRKFEYVNKAFLDLFGYSSLEDVNKVRPSSLYADESMRDIMQGRLTAEGTINNIEVKFRKKNGEEFWGLISSSFIVDRKGRKIFDGAVRDITSEKEAREQLRESEQMLSSINLNIKEGIYRSSFKKGLVYVNEAFVEMFGYTSKE